MEVIVPAAGLSTRFPGMRPKYSLTDHTGYMMIERAIKHYVDQHHITVGMLREHVDAYPILDYLKSKYPNTDFVILEQRTLGPAHTVAEIIKQGNIEPQSSLLIKDCDSFFTHDQHDGNFVCVSSIADHEVLKRLSSKSFVRANDQGIITDIMEKQVISDLFCVGGYHFTQAQMFADCYNALDKNTGEIYVSHVIQKCLEQGEIFVAQRVTNYIDVGTAEDWHEYNDLAVIFCDIDGTIVKAQSREEFGQPPTPLPANIQLIQQKVKQGCQLVFTTARPTEKHQEIYDMLCDLGFDNFQLITGLKNVKRVLINDYNRANPYPRAIAINIPRDSDTIGDFW